MSDILNSLNDLKSKISDLETDLDLKKEELPESKKDIDNTEIIAERVKLVKNMQNQKVTINCGGRKFTISKTALESTKQSNIFQESIKSLSPNEEIFIDGSHSHFSYVIEVIKKLTKTSDYSSEKKLEIIIGREDDDFIISEMLREIFTSESEELLSCVKIVKRIEQQTGNNNNTNNTTNTNNNNNNNVNLENSIDYGANYDRNYDDYY